MAAAERITKPIKPKHCKSCRALFVPFSTLAKVCSPVCALALVRKDTGRLERARLNAAKKAHRADKERVKRRSDWLREAQDAFNDFIRARDYAESCIDCGQYKNDLHLTGGGWDAGHFLGVGSHPELRFEESNCHKQLKSCNGGSGKYARKGRTVAGMYEQRLRAKIGDAAVDWLQGPHAPKKYTIDDLKAIKAEYRLKLKELKNNNQSA